MLHVNPVSTQTQADRQSGRLILGPPRVSAHRANLSLSLIRMATLAMSMRWPRRKAVQ